MSSTELTSSGSSTPPPGRNDPTNRHSPPVLSNFWFLVLLIVGIALFIFGLLVNAFAPSIYSVNNQARVITSTTSVPFVMVLLTILSCFSILISIFFVIRAARIIRTRNFPTTLVGTAFIVSLVVLIGILLRDIDEEAISSSAVAALILGVLAWLYTTVATGLNMEWDGRDDQQPPTDQP
ncbi:hypothetical protein [Candidatus Similichlamydia epinepheli]|uniref:hypothetical protein n=1 Tax=Candidatus Similichlamydia epinepheli TaxID=1903953 RepID=UPI0013008B64|nr:hypothetical protein [Candidatus Similichlamydia epinepheli]